MVIDGREERVAQQYRDEGYTVISRPRGEAVPPFVAGNEIDMIATRGDEKVIVEVRSTRADLSKDQRLNRLAELTNGQPGWRFDLVILEPESPVTRAVEKASEPSNEQILARLGRARTAVSSGLSDMAIVYAWAGLEAALRQVRDEGELYGGTSSSQLLSTLYSNGFLTRTEFDRAKQAWNIRTQAVHGFVTPNVDPALLDDIIALATKLIGCRERPEAVAAT